MFLILGFGLIVGNACTETKATQEWNNITVDVKADNEVETSQEMTSEEVGLQGLTITLSNKGSEIITLESVEIRMTLCDLV